MGSHVLRPFCCSTGKDVVPGSDSPSAALTGVPWAASWGTGAASSSGLQATDPGLCPPHLRPPWPVPPAGRPLLSPERGGEEVGGGLVLGGTGQRPSVCRVLPAADRPSAAPLGCLATQSQSPRRSTRWSEIVTMSHRWEVHAAWALCMLSLLPEGPAVT